MRIALCFWGLCRSTQYTVDSYKEYVLKPLLDAGFEVDIYLHTYQLFRPYTNTRANEHNIQLSNTSYKLLGATITMVENQDAIDKGLQFNAYKSNGDPWVTISTTDTFTTDWETFHNHIRALWSLKQVTYLWTLTGKQYNRVIYVRPDVKFRTKLQINWVTHCGQNEICIPNFHCVDGVNDRFAIGWPKTMTIYGNRFDSALQYSKQFPLHSERFLAWILKANAKQVVPIPFRFQRVRANGQICPADYELL